MRFVLHCGEWRQAGRTRGAWHQRTVYEVEVLEGEEDAHLSAEGVEVRTDGRFYNVRQGARPRDLEGTVEAAQCRSSDKEIETLFLLFWITLSLFPELALCGDI